MVDKNKVEKLIQQIQLADSIEIIGVGSDCECRWDGEVKGDPENQVLLLTWEDDGTQEFSVILTEQGLSDAKCDGNAILCNDHEGNETQIFLWKLSPLDIIFVK
jgi:hypothetical protein